jgi:hypothetical protein
MSFYLELLRRTDAERLALRSSPIIAEVMGGGVALPSYHAFLHEAYHHVRHTVPLLERCRAALPDRLGWMRPALDAYVDEESGHDEWILQDIAASGGDADATRHGQPGLATEVMVAYAYDQIARIHPLGFLGMVHVLEGTSAGLALAAADRIAAGLGLGDGGLRYLRSHGTLDQAHAAHYAQLVDRLDQPADREAIVHATRVFYRLYGDVFRGLPLPSASGTGRRAA